MTATRSEPVVAMIGNAAILNGEVLAAVQDKMSVDVVHAAFLHSYNDQSPVEELIRHLTGAGSKVFMAAKTIFKDQTMQEPAAIKMAVIDANLALGDSFRDGDYTELERFFPNLETIMFACGHNKILDFDMPARQVELEI